MPSSREIVERNPRICAMYLVTESYLWLRPQTLPVLQEMGAFDAIQERFMPYTTSCRTTQSLLLGTLIGTWFIRIGNPKVTDLAI